MHVKKMKARKARKKIKTREARKKNEGTYLGKAKQCELITQITFYNNNFGELSQIYRAIHFHTIKLLS